VWIYENLGIHGHEISLPFSSSAAVRSLQGKRQRGRKEKKRERERDRERERGRERKRGR